MDQPIGHWRTIGEVTGKPLLANMKVHKNKMTLVMRFSGRYLSCGSPLTVVIIHCPL